MKLVDNLGIEPSGHQATALQAVHAPYVSTCPWQSDSDSNRELTVLETGILAD